MPSFKEKKILRILDANLNRTKEALRVCEDVTRFVLNDKRSTRQYKIVRHNLSDLFGDLPLSNDKLFKARDISSDVGKESIDVELKRESIKDIFCANSQRIKESTRVLEEFAKLISKNKAQGFKKIRYKIYDLERTIIEKF